MFTKEMLIFKEQTLRGCKFCFVHYILKYWEILNRTIRDPLSWQEQNPQELSIFKNSSSTESYGEKGFRGMKTFSGCDQSPFKSSSTMECKGKILRSIRCHCSALPFLYFDAYDMETRLSNSIMHENIGKNI